MEIIAFEKSTLDAVNNAFESFVNRIDAICAKHDKKVSEWLDSSEVCQLLNISKRTLQSYRENGTLPYTQINYKMFYKSSDIEQLFKPIVSKVA